MRWRRRRVTPRADRPDWGEEADAFRADARAALAAGKLDEAIEALGQAALLQPRSADLHVELGGLLERAGRIEAARRAHERALDVDPSHPGARAAAKALPPEPPKRSNFTVGQLLQGSRGSSSGGLEQIEVLDVRKGGFGAVYIVRDTDTRKRFALKSFDARLLWSDDDRRRFLVEATTWINLDPHPNVVTARSAQLIEGFPCLVMDYVDGGDLGDRLVRGPLRASTAVRLSLQLCDGMEHARRQLGLVHRDLKPSNCMLTKNGVLRITDFGLARALRHAQETSLDLSDKHTAGRTLYTTVAGTPPYMAPEQFLLGAQLDTRTDLFAFGVMLYQMLTGDVPAVGRAHRYVDRWRTSGHAARELANLARACVDPDPNRRPATFGDIREELAKMYRRLTGTAAPLPPPPGKVSAYTWVDRSIAFRNLSLPEQALVAADRGLALAAGDSDDVAHGHLWQVRGLALVDLDRHVEALECYDRALEFVPEEPSTWVCKGGALNELGRHEEALSCNDQCLSIAPGYPTALRNKAATLEDLGRLNEAETAYHRAAELIPRDVELLVNWANLLRRQERYDEALQRIEQALAIAPRDAYAWRRLELLRASMGQVEDGLAAYERSLEINPRDPRTWALRGDALAAVGRPADAVISYDEALTRNPNFITTWVDRAVALSELGRIDDALDSCDRALTLDPQYLAAQEMRKRLLQR